MPRAPDNTAPDDKAPDDNDKVRDDDALKFVQANFNDHFVVKLASI